MKVVVARRAEIAILATWDWNEERYGSGHATRYTDALRERIASLGEEPTSGRRIGDDPTLRYVEVRRGRHHGHAIVFETGDDSIVLTGVYHTAQDWRSRLEEP